MSEIFFVRRAAALSPTNLCAAIVFLALGAAVHAQPATIALLEITPAQSLGASTSTTVATNAKGNSPPSAPSSAVTLGETGTLLLQKQVPAGEGDPDNPNQTFGLEILDENGVAIAGATVEAGQPPVGLGFDAGSYFVAEADLAPGWILDDISCTSDDGTSTFGDFTPGIPRLAVELAADDRVVCTFTNSFGSPPSAPTNATATAGNAEADVSWDAPADDGGSTITGYTATSLPDGQTCTTTGATTCTVTGLTNGTSYSFTVVATNAEGDSPPSTPSNAVTPVGPGTLLVQKQVPAGDGDPDNPNQTFGLEILDENGVAIAGATVEAGQPPVGLGFDAGSYFVAEADLAPGWILDDISCTSDDGTSTFGDFTPGIPRLAVELAADDRVVCTFTNSFTTQPEPGDCPIGATAIPAFSDDMENGINGWTIGAGSVQNTWAQTTDNSVSGVTSWNAENLDSQSDQRLVSPSLDLPGPAELPLTLRFWNRQEIEAAEDAGCWDGAIVEITTDGGANWTELSDPRVLFREHDGIVNNFGGGPNPLTGLPAWCGDFRDWEDYVIDLSDFAGETVQLRFRVGTDGTVGEREGWTIDDVRVESCVVIDELFADDFESPEPPPM